MLHIDPSLMPSTKFELVSDTVAVVAIGAPWWMSFLRESSEVAALVLPILGVVWLSTQIAIKWYSQFRGK